MRRNPSERSSQPCSQMNCPAGRWYTSLAAISGATRGEIFMVVKAAADSTSANRRMMAFGTSPYGSAYPWSDGNIYEDFGSNLEYLAGGPQQHWEQYHVYNVSSAPNEWVARFDGFEAHRESTNTVAFRSDPVLGRADLDNSFTGDIAEVIIYDHVLDPGERERVNWYLASKYLLPDFDLDGDGLTNSQEQSLGTDPYNWDTNGDGFADGPEYYAGFDPASNDVDGDGLTNAQEILIGTNPFDPDTDRDGIPDGQDAFPLDPFRWQPLVNDPNDHTAPAITLIEPANAVLLP